MTGMRTAARDCEALQIVRHIKSVRWNWLVKLGWFNGGGWRQRSPFTYLYRANPLSPLFPVLHSLCIKAGP